MASAPHDALPADPVERALVRARGVLPDQGPIGVFIHHNTLHAFQHLPFHEGVQAGAADLQARPYLSQREFRSALASGRIADDDLRVEIDRQLGERTRELVLPGLTRAELWYQLMATSCDTDDAMGLEFSIASGAARECADLALWRACLDRVARGPRLVPDDTRVFRRHRDVLVALDATDTDVAVHGELIRLGSGFLDQGQAHAVVPGRERGFLRAVTQVYRNGASAPRDCRGAEPDMRQVAEGDTPADAVIRASLAALGVSADDAEPFLFATALALPGWTGMFSRLERHPEDHPGGPPVTLIEFLAVRLLLERRAIENVCRRRQLPTAWPELRRLVPPLPARPASLDSALLWGLAHAAELTPELVGTLSDDTLASLWRECVACSDLARRRVFQDAYERSYRRTILDAMAARRALPSDPIEDRPRAQFVFCIDEREESIRRALEEQRPDYITFGMAGFFGVAIDYQGLYDREPAAHCPVVVTPAHEVHEQPVYTDLGRHLLSRRWRDRWLGVERRAMAASRTMSGGAGMSFLLGPLSAVKTLARVAAPRSSLRLGERMLSSFTPRPTTRLSTIRAADAAPIDGPGKPVGFSLDESVDRVTAVLNNLGLVRDFAPIVIFLGHGSTSLNNPHESAHDCGACGGRRGGANARLFADMANRLDVREGVRQRGINIPADTWFVGALHDTADDSVRYYDLEALPASLSRHFDEAYAALEHARRESAQERCRRFHDAPLDITADEALRHVEARSAHLAQPRPEYGHCTNSICIVGRRAISRGLHLDRRAFLVSYDPTIDQDHKILERILAAVGPVGAGISLEYYFSSVDNETFGCGTKLPHNVTGLIGVMNGHQSDLRTGLPLQMVEIHEPMRLLLMVDATPEALLTVAGRQAEVAELVVNQWVQLVSVHPDTGAMAVFDQGQFVPYEPTPTLLPVVERSPEWHMRTREHVTPALVRRALPVSAVGPGHRTESITAAVSS
jgi:uncharacterized protein